MEELNANRLHVYQRGMHLEVDISILKCDFCNTLESFLPLPLLLSRTCVGNEGGITGKKKKKRSDAGRAHRGLVPLIRTFGTLRQAHSLC